MRPYAGRPAASVHINLLTVTVGRFHAGQLEVAEDLDGQRCNGELTQLRQRNDRAGEAACSISQLVTSVGQLAAHALNSHCRIWILGKKQVAGFGFSIGKIPLPNP